MKKKLIKAAQKVCNKNIFQANLNFNIFQSSYKTRKRKLLQRKKKQD